jgi:hypothetical protein
MCQENCDALLGLIVAPRVIRNVRTVMRCLGFDWDIGPRGYQ